MLDLLIIIPSLREGGAEKFSVNLFNSYNSAENVELLSVSKDGSFYELIDHKDKVTRLGGKRVLTSIHAIYKFIRLKKPKTIFTMFLHLSSVILFLKMIGVIKSRVVIREVNLPSKLLAKKKYPYIYKYIYRYLYPLADVIVCQSEDMFNELQQYTCAQLRLINNPVNCRLTRLMAETKPKDILSFKSNKENHLVFIGRLTYQKGIDLLVEFIASCQDDTMIHIFGSGSLEKWLIKQVETLGLGDRVLIYGVIKNPFYILAKADFLVMSSRYEGFPNVALEALSLGIPIIAVPFKGGQKEIFEDGINCVLANDMTGVSLYLAYKKALTLKFNSHQIAEDTFKKFDISVIAYSYKRVLS